MPLVSILVPLYNAEHYVAEAIQSALDQSAEDFEIVISDNNSSDGSMDVARRFKDSRIRFFQQETNIGMVRNWRFVMEQAAGQFAMILGADDRLARDHILTRLELHRRFPETWLSCGHADHIDSAGRRIGEGNLHLPEHSQPGDVLPRMFEGNIVNILAAFFRLDRCREHGLAFSSAFTLLPDWRLWLDLILLGNGLLFSANKTVEYRRHADSVTGRSRPTAWVAEGATLVCDFLETQRDRLRELGIESDEMAMNITANVWLSAQRALRDGKASESVRSFELYFRYHSLGELIRSAYQELTKNTLRARSPG